MLIRLIAILTNLLLFHQWGTTLPNFSRARPIGPRRRARGDGRRRGRHPARAGGRRSSGATASPRRWRRCSTRRAASRPRTAVAKPLSAAIAIGTGGPFGAEGPIIVTGGALGSLVGQVHPRVGQRAQDPARRAAPPPAWRPRSARRWPRSCWPSSCCCSSSRPGRSSRSSSRRAWPAACTSLLFGAGRCSPCPRTTSPGSVSSHCSPSLGLACGLLAVAHHPRPVRRRGPVPPPAGRRGLAPGHRRRSVWASLGLLVPRALGVGYDVIDDVLAGRLAAGHAGRAVPSASS